MLYANKNDADQSARMIFVVRCLDRIISTLAQSKISRLELVAVVDYVGLSYTWSQPPENTFSRDVASMQNDTPVIMFN